MGTYAPKSAPSLMTLNKQFENLHLKNTTDNPEAWIMELEDIHNQMDEIHLMQAMTNDNIMHHVMAIFWKSIKQLVNVFRVVFAIKEMIS